MIDLARAAGKYGAYIWPAYGLTVVVFAAMIAETLGRCRRWRREVDRLRAELAEDGGAGAP